MVNKLVFGLVRYPSGRGVVALLNRPASGVRPRDHITDVPDRTTGEAHDRRGKRWARSISSLPDIYGVRFHAEHLADLLRARKVSGVIHVITVGERHVLIWSARRRCKPTEISYSSGRTPVRWKGLR